MIFYQITRPASYLLIKDQSKWKLDWLLPINFTAIVTAALCYLPGDFVFYGDKGVMPQIQSFLQILPGFYLASLAAISTFNKEDLDYHLPKPTPEIKVLVNGHKTWIKLTRRRMLCYLFGYLTFLSLMLYLSTLIGFVAATDLTVISKQYAPFVMGALRIGFAVFFFQMVIVTIFGLYQLCDRIHHPENSESM